MAPALLTGSQIFGVTCVSSTATARYTITVCDVLRPPQVRCPEDRGKLIGRYGRANYSQATKKIPENRPITGGQVRWQRRHQGEASDRGSPASPRAGIASTRIGSEPSTPA